MSRLSNDHLPRALVILVLLGLLCSLFVWFGTVTYDPAMNSFPENDEIGPNPEAYTGQQVSIGGVVVATDPVVVEMEYGFDGSRQLTLDRVDEDIAVGQHVSAFGTLTDASTLDTERALVSSPWEIWYMFAVSILGGLWVAGRIATHWTIDRSQLAVVPRGERDG